MTPAAPRSRAARASAVDVFHALSDETRLAVLEMLRGGERCVCDLQGALDAAQSRLSFHLKVLKDAGLVSDRKDGRWSYYKLNAERLAEATAVLDDLATSSAAAAPVELYSLARTSRGVSSNGVKSVRSPRRRPAVGESDDGCC